MNHDLSDREQRTMIQILLHFVWRRTESEFLVSYPSNSGETTRIRKKNNAWGENRVDAVKKFLFRLAVFFHGEKEEKVFLEGKVVQRESRHRCLAISSRLSLQINTRAEMYSNLTVPFHLSSNSKVLQYLQQSNTTPRPSSLPNDFLSDKESLHPYSRPTRTRCDSDEDSLGLSDSSPPSSHDSSCTSFTEELDFNLSFDTETDSTISDLDELVRQSSEDTLCSPESDPHCAAGIRSNSLSIVSWNDKTSYLSKKVVRFADMLVSCLEHVNETTSEH